MSHDLYNRAAKKKAKRNAQYPFPNCESIGSDTLNITNPFAT